MSTRLLYLMMIRLVGLAIDFFHVDTILLKWLYVLVVLEVATRETAYLTISPPAAEAHPDDLQEWIRRAGNPA